MKILLPAQINPPRIRKDGSCGLSFDTRELNAEEIFTIMQMRHSEGWLCFAPNEEQIEIPEEEAKTDTKTPSARLRDTLFVLYKQKEKNGEEVGLFDTFYKKKMEQLIQVIKDKLD